MNNCLFCKIIDKKLPAELIFENEKIISFFDVNPLSRGHLLIVTKKHYENLTLIEQEDWNQILPILKKCFQMINKKFSPKGFNVVSNIGEEAYQTINHIHIHLVPKYNKNEGFLWR